MNKLAYPLVVFIILLSCCMNKQSDLITICEENADTTDMDRCYMDAALMHVTTGPCDKIRVNDTMNICYVKVAKYSGNYRICNEIQDEGYQFYCLAWVNGDSSFCEDAKVLGGKDLCYYWIARTMSNLTLCEKINETGQKDACYVEVASQERNSTICEKVVMLSKKDECFRTVAIQSRNPALCSKIKDDEVKEMCYSWAK
jgi:hypothetical protein